MAKDRQPDDPPPVLAGYEEPSLVFALGADTALTDGSGAAEWARDKAAWRWWKMRNGPHFLARLAELEADATRWTICQALIIRAARPSHVTLYRVAPLHASRVT